MKAHTTPIPEGNALHAAQDRAYFAHCAAVRLPRRPASALQAYLDLAALAPRWFEGLMAVRNRGMRALGMKDLGRIADARPPGAPRPGDRLGIFTLRHLDDDQIVLGDDDRHLSVSLSLQLGGAADAPSLHCATVVERPNAFGRLYMLPVDPVHRLIVPHLLQRYARRLGAAAASLPGADDAPSTRSTP